MRIECLASGSKANCLLVEVPDGWIMLDAGLGAKVAFRRMLDLGIAPESVLAVCVGHEHGDHTAGLLSITGKLDLPIYLSAGTMGALPWGGFYRPTVVVFHPGAEFPIGGAVVRTFAIPHDAAESCGFTVTSLGIRFAYAVDLGSITPEVERAINGADQLFLEANYDADMLRAGSYHEALRQRVSGPLGHLSNEQCASYLRRASMGASEVILGHLSSENNNPVLVALLAHEALDGRAKLSIAKPDGGIVPG